ncbi:hypothetical protein ABK040_006807 [Willaertia magna]
MFPNFLLGLVTGSNNTVPANNNLITNNNLNNNQHLSNNNINGNNNTVLGKRNSLPTSSNNTNISNNNEKKQKNIEIPIIPESVLKAYSKKETFDYVQKVFSIAHANVLQTFDIGQVFLHRLDDHHIKVISKLSNERGKVTIILEKFINLKKENEWRINYSKCSCCDDILWCKHIVSSLMILQKRPEIVIVFEKIESQLKEKSKEQLINLILNLAFDEKLKNFEKLQNLLNNGGSNNYLFDENINEELEISSNKFKHFIDITKIREKLRSAYEKFTSGNPYSTGCDRYDCDCSCHYRRRFMFDECEDCMQKTIYRFNMDEVIIPMNEVLNIAKSLYSVNEIEGALSVLKTMGNIISSWNFSDDFLNGEVEDEIEEDEEEMRWDKYYRFIESMNDLLKTVLLDKTLSTEVKNKWIEILDDWCDDEGGSENKFRRIFGKTQAIAKTSWNDKILSQVLSGSYTGTFSEEKDIQEARLFSLSRELTEANVVQMYYYSKAVGWLTISVKCLIILGRIEEALNMALSQDCAEQVVHIIKLFIYYNVQQSKKNATNVVNLDENILTDIRNEVSKEEKEIPAIETSILDLPIIFKQFNNNIQLNFHTLYHFGVNVLQSNFEKVDTKKLVDILLQLVLLMNKLDQFIKVLLDLNISIGFSVVETIYKSGKKDEAISLALQSMGSKDTELVVWLGEQITKQLNEGNEVLLKDYMNSLIENDHRVHFFNFYKVIQTRPNVSQEIKDMASQYRIKLFEQIIKSIFGTKYSASEKSSEIEQLNWCLKGMELDLLTNSFINNVYFPDVATYMFNKYQDVLERKTEKPLVELPNYENTRNFIQEITNTLFIASTDKNAPDQTKRFIFILCEYLFKIVISKLAKVKTIRSPCSCSVCGQVNSLLETEIIDEIDVNLETPITGETLREREKHVIQSIYGAFDYQTNSSSAISFIYLHPLRYRILKNMYRIRDSKERQQNTSLQFQKSIRKITLDMLLGVLSESKNSNFYQEYLSSCKEIISFVQQHVTEEKGLNNHRLDSMGDLNFIEALKPFAATKKKELVQTIVDIGIKDLDKNLNSQTTLMNKENKNYEDSIKVEISKRNILQICSFLKPLSISLNNIPQTLFILSTKFKQNLTPNSFLEIRNYIVQQMKLNTSNTSIEFWNQQWIYISHNLMDWFHEYYEKQSKTSQTISTTNAIELFVLEGFLESAIKVIKERVRYSESETMTLICFLVKKASHYGISPSVVTPFIKDLSMETIKSYSFTRQSMTLMDNNIIDLAKCGYTDLAFDLMQVKKEKVKGVISNPYNSTVQWLENVKTVYEYCQKSDEWSNELSLFLRTHSTKRKLISEVKGKTDFSTANNKPIEVTVNSTPLDVVGTVEEPIVLED